jgi:Zn-finger nucleic acid-binding protein
MAKQYPCVGCLVQDEIPMQKIRCGPDLEVDRCRRCGGIWLDCGEFEKLIELGSFYIGHLDEPAEAEPEINPERKCPKCRVRLKVMRYEKMPEVEVDVCPQCGGLWCDAGELKAISAKYHG